MAKTTDELLAEYAENTKRVVDRLDGIGKSLDEPLSPYRKGIKDDVRQLLQKQNQMFLKLAVLLPVTVIGLVAVVCGMLLWTQSAPGGAGRTWPETVYLIVLLVVGATMALGPLAILWKHSLDD